MKHERVTVTARTDGSQHTGFLARCDCAAEVFNVLEIYHHLHLQCVECGAMYCQQQTGDPCVLRVEEEEESLQ